MRILKEYSKLFETHILDDSNSIELPLEDEMVVNVVDYIKSSVMSTEIQEKTLNSLNTATSDIMKTLVSNAGLHETVRVSCTYHKYYYMLVFEFSEAALPLHTLNKSVKVLDIGKEKSEDDIGFMNIVHLVNRVDVSVNKITEKMRITVIKEKNYAYPKLTDSFSEILAPYSFSEIDIKLAEDFSARVYNWLGNKADKFLTIPELFIDNLAVSELEAAIISDSNGNACGGIVWQQTNGITVLMAAANFTNDKSVTTMLILEFERRLQNSDSCFVVAKNGFAMGFDDYFDICDEKYCYKSLSANNQKKITSYIKPDLIPLLKKTYKDFEVNREIREINYTYKFLEPYSVLTAKIDTASSEALLSILWSGDDLKTNIIRHIIALNRVGIEHIYFRLDLGIPEQAAVSDLIQSCGFEAKYLWPFSSSYGDIVVFEYNAITVYEMKPCGISPVNKSNIDKTPALVKSVYDDKYPSQYLYNPELFWEKIRKRSVYPYIAIDDESEAVGMISFVKLSANPYLFEIGQLMVKPEHRGTNVANQLIEYIYTDALKVLDFDAVISESVTNHKFSQRSCVSSGFIDVALKLNIMSEDAFNLENKRRQIGRMSCVVSCIERADENFTVFLPSIYEKNIIFCFEGLKTRIFEQSKETLPEVETITEYQINEDEVDTSSLINVTFFKIGNDIKDVVQKLENFAEIKKIKSMLVNIPLGDKHNAAIVNELKNAGFFFGGVMPYWLPQSDALLMQKLYNNSPDWDSIKLFSRKIKSIAQMIKDEINS